jgi:hypothetical protein
MLSRNLKLLIILVVTGTIAIYVVLVAIPTQLAKRSYAAARTLGDDFRKMFQFTPEVKVNNTIVLGQQSPVMELAVLSQNFEHRYTWSNAWMGSTKRIYITGTFNAKVGFDLHERVSITLQDGKAFVSLPEPVVLSVESEGNIQYRDEHGIWNWVSIDDRTRATNAFITDARRYAEQALFVQDARKNMEEKLKRLLSPHVDEVTIRYATPVILQ